MLILYRDIDYVNSEKLITLHGYARDAYTTAKPSRLVALLSARDALPGIINTLWLRCVLRIILFISMQYYLSGRSGVAGFYSGW